MAVHPTRSVRWLPVLLTVGGLASPAGARDAEPPAGVYPAAVYALDGFSHNVGSLVLQITNLGAFGNRLADYPSAIWNGGEYLSSAGLWIGAIENERKLVSTFSPFELRPELDPIWTIYESYEGIRNGVRLGARENPADADDDGDGLLDEDSHDGFDNDGDGLIDEDYGAYGQQMFSCIYRDDTPEAVSTVAGHEPLGVFVRQKSFQWSIAGFDRFVGFHYEIVNAGELILRDLYLGVVCDADIGLQGDETDYWENDLAGWDHLDTTLRARGGTRPCFTFDTSFDTAFMWDSQGTPSGVFGGALLDHTTDPLGTRAPKVGMASVTWFTAQALPDNDTQRYDALASGSRPTTNSRTGVALGSTAAPGDYRTLFSTGPFLIQPGESRTLSIAYAVGEGFTGFREAVGAAASVHRGTWIDADADPNTGIDGRERCLRVLEAGQPIVWDDPCDTLSSTIEWRQTTCLWVDADCDPCTGVQGKETRTPWTGPLTLPDPVTNLNPDIAFADEPAGDGQVVLQWDNRPECLPDHPGNPMEFEGYRLWKVSDWTADSAPAREDWILLNEFRLNPTDGQGQASPNHLDRVTRTEVDPVGVTDQGCRIYPVRRYQYVDGEVENARRYHYAVTTLSVQDGEDLWGAPTSYAGWVVEPGSTPVRLLWLTAERSGPGVAIRWEVADAVNHAGFHVHREEEGGDRVRISNRILTGGPVYEFRDEHAPRGEARYWLAEFSRAGDLSWHGPVTVAAAPNRPPLVLAAHPNPFSGAARISYSVPVEGWVTMTVFDARGRRLEILWNDRMSPGEYELTWRAPGTAAGVYFMHLQTPAGDLTRKVLTLP